MFWTIDSYDKTLIVNIKIKLIVAKPISYSDKWFLPVWNTLSVSGYMLRAVHNLVRKLRKMVSGILKTIRYSWVANPNWSASTNLLLNIIGGWQENIELKCYCLIWYVFVKHNFVPSNSFLFGRILRWQVLSQGHRWRNQIRSGNSRKSYKISLFH